MRHVLLWLLGLALGGVGLYVVVAAARHAGAVDLTTACTGGGLLFAGGLLIDPAKASAIVAAIRGALVGDRAGERR